MTKPKYKDYKHPTPCAVCQVVFIPRVYTQKYCSVSCKTIAMNAIKSHRYATDPAFHAHINEMGRNCASRKTRATNLTEILYRKQNKDRYKQLNKTKYIERRNTRPWEFMIISARNRARTNGILFDLSNNWAKLRWTGRCELTHIPFVVGGKRSAFSASLDRKDPNKGYTQDNCWIILWGINLLKQGDKLEITLAFIRQVSDAMDAPLFAQRLVV
jgi:hypothetical protein